MFTDDKITIDQVIQQLRELIPQWEELGRAADIQPSVLKEVSETNMDMCIHIHIHYSCENIHCIHMERDRGLHLI